MKPTLDNWGIARRAALELKDGEVVNLGVGIPMFIPVNLPTGVDLVLHSETGPINYSHMLTQDEAHMGDLDYVLPGGQFFLPGWGLSSADMPTAHMVEQSGRLDVSVLGTLEVSETGDISNWTLEMDGKVGGIGGGMDFAALANKVIITMKHVTKEGKPKILKKCRLPVTAKACVDTIITDIAVIDVTGKGLLLREMMPGWTVAEVQALTEPKLLVSPGLREMQL